MELSWHTAQSKADAKAAIDFDLDAEPTIRSAALIGVESAMTAHHPSPFAGK
jgi:hypothetical protein